MWQTLGPWEQEADGEIVLSSSGLTPSPPWARSDLPSIWLLGPVVLPAQASVTFGNSQLATASLMGLPLPLVTPAGRVHSP